MPIRDISNISRVRGPNLIPSSDFKNSLEIASNYKECYLSILTEKFKFISIKPKWEIINFHTDVIYYSVRKVSERILFLQKPGGFQ